MRKIIAFCGMENSGKDYSCKRLMTTKGFEKLAFADTLREIAFRTIGIPYNEGIQKYEELKRTELINKLTFRNILENLGSSVRKYDRDFWARAVLTKIASTHKNICISDLRYPNEYKLIKDYCDKLGYEFKLIFCDYKGAFYNDKNPHESAKFAEYLKDLGYEDQQEISHEDVLSYELTEIKNSI